MRDEILEKKIDSDIRVEVSGVQTQMQSFNYFLFIMKIEVLVLTHNRHFIFSLAIHTGHVLKLSKLEKHVFQHYKKLRKTAISLWSLKKMTSDYLEKQKFGVIMSNEKLL